MTLDELNALPSEDARAELLRCCGSVKWAAGMAKRRPFRSVGEVLAAADELGDSMSETDWKESFSHHPKIGDLEGLKKKFAATSQWAAGEQAGVGQASEDVLQKLAEGNRLYEEKFGYIFIVCATGKSAVEILALLNDRLHNSPDKEMCIAAAEQAQITKLRLRKVFLE